jgi:predicted enzyme related to lactoylglutathione lyase
MSRLSHIHIPVDDIDRAKKFYRDVFGWEVEETGSMYQMMRMEPKSERGQPVPWGATYGGLYKRQRSGEPLSLVIEVPSLDEAIRKVQAAGGKLVTPKERVGVYELLAEVRDTEGNLFGLIEKPKPRV